MFNYWCHVCVMINVLVFPIVFLHKTFTSKGVILMIILRKPLTLCLLETILRFGDNLFKQFIPRSGSTTLFHTLVVLGILIVLKKKIK